MLFLLFNINFDIGQLDNPIKVAFFVLLIILSVFLFFAKIKNSKVIKKGHLDTKKITATKNSNQAIVSGNNNNIYVNTNNKNNETSESQICNNYKDALATKLYNLNDIVKRASSVYENEFMNQNVNYIANVMQDTNLYNDDVNYFINYAKLLQDINQIIADNILHLNEKIRKNLDGIVKLFDFERTIGIDEYFTFELAANIMECSHRNKKVFDRLISEIIQILRSESN